MSENERKIWRFLLKAISSVNGLDELDSLMTFLLTPEERSMLVKRVLITQELLNGKAPQMQIAKDLGVSISKITRGSNELKRCSSKTELLIKRLLTEG